MQEKINNTEVDNPNKITTKSYLIKRLKDSGYSIDKLENIEYSKEDKRKFSILLDNGGVCLIITVMKSGVIQINDGDRLHDIFQKHKFLDEERKVTKSKNKRITSSIELLVEYLNDKGVVTKHRSYGNRNELEEQ
jgi:hypothetical protein